MGYVSFRHSSVVCALESTDVSGTINSVLSFLLFCISVTAGHNSDGKFIARAQRIEFDCELIPRRVAIFIEKSKDGQIMPVPNVVVRDVACGANHTVRGFPEVLTGPNQIRWPAIY